MLIRKVFFAANDLAQKNTSMTKIPEAHKAFGIN